MEKKKVEEKAAKTKEEKAVKSKKVKEKKSGKKEKDKSKKLVIYAIVIIAVIVVIAIGLLTGIFTKETKVLKEENFVAYVKINPLVKLEFTDSYYECSNRKGKSYICSEHTNEVKAMKSLNKDAKEIYKDTQLNGKSLEEAIYSLTKVAADNNIDISNFKIITDFNYELDNLNKTIKNKIKKELNKDINIDIKQQEEITEQEIIVKEAEVYEVTFDSDGGSDIEKQAIKENEKVKKPTNPTKDGYNFKEWQLDGKTYDFNETVTSNITLKATWEKKVENTNKQNSNNNQPSKPTCRSKVFSQKYSYAYESEATCISNGNTAFMNVSDNDSTIFSYGCEAVVDECGKTWYGVYFTKYTDQGNIKVHY